MIPFYTSFMKTVKNDIWQEIEEAMKNPKFIKAVREFIKRTT